MEGFQSLVKQAKDAGLVTADERIEQTDYVQTTIEELRNTPFWCNQIQNCGDKCLSHIAGLPKHPETLNEMGFLPYQIRFKNIIDKSPYHKYHANKARQMGFSEVVMRIFQERGFKKYTGKRQIYVAGTREKTTKKLMARFKDLYKRIPDVLENNHDSLYLELTDGTKYEGLPANPEALTGDTKIGGVAMDEAAKWNRKDDQEVLNAYGPIVQTNKSEFFMFSTPKGPRGIFYHTEMDENDFMKFKFNIYETEGYLYTKEDIEKMLADKTVDVNQEYLNQYTTGRGAVFGSTFPEEQYETEEY